MSEPANPEALKSLPAINTLVDDPALSDERARFGRPAVVDTARAVVAVAREAVLAGYAANVSAEDVRTELNRHASRMKRVINATGVILHTNLGRAPLADAAREAIAQAAGYTNVELDLATGLRGGRDAGIDAHLHALTGSERAFAVNNGAAAALLMLAATSAGKEVIVSRGELVEIGGGFRVPDVLAQSGCKLVEVGTTNRTRIEDYERAISTATGALLKVHRSNFRIVGFVEEVDLPSLAALAKKANVPALYDQGSGDLPTLRAAIDAGIDAVVCSGDKLLGGPQAGLLLGKDSYISAMRRHPLARALRIDKLTLAALEATLALCRFGRTAEIPTVAMLAESASQVRDRAEALSRLIGDSVAHSIVETESVAGGGARPADPIASFGVRIEHPEPEMYAAKLRAGNPPVIARIIDSAVVMDLRTVSTRELEELATAIRAAK